MPFYPTNNPKNHFLKKWKKIPGEIIILHKCSKNHDHMLDCSCNMACDECNFFLFWTIFWTFNSLTGQKIKILKKVKKSPEISSFYTSAPNIMIRRCMVPEIWCMTNRRMDRQMDRGTDGQTKEQKKWPIEVSASPKNYWQ